MDGAPKGNYDVELVMSQYKSCSVFKRYYVPLLTKLPAELKVRCCLAFVGGGGGGGVARGGTPASTVPLEVVIISGRAILLLWQRV